ncbi:hypothetical protein LCGC14_1494460 [marine sediment metagenome]|uniref:Uncharacterized protein n=1 Tax=marine sediment metagenome TaxID=412755 RepID=A0A0F9M7D8_9ZZZZ
MAVRERTKPVDWRPVVGVAAGIAAVAGGLVIYYVSKPKGIKVGEEFRVLAKVEHFGPGKEFITQLSLGHWREVTFDEVEGLKWRADFPVDDDLEDWKTYDIVIDCGPIPEGLEPGTYDAELSLRVDGIYEGQRVIVKGAIRIVG